MSKLDELVEFFGAEGATFVRWTPMGPTMRASAPDDATERVAALLTLAQARAARIAELEVLAAELSRQSAQLRWEGAAGLSKASARIAELEAACLPAAVENLHKHRVRIAELEARTAELEERMHDLVAENARLQGQLPRPRRLEPLCEKCGGPCRASEPRETLDIKGIAALETALGERQREQPALLSRIAELEAEKDGAYAERNKLVSALSKLFPSHRAKHGQDPSWDPDWLTIVFIQTPVGQLSWHIHDSEAELFAHLAERPNEWDGHTTEQKYERLASLEPVAELEEENEVARAALQARIAELEAERDDFDKTKVSELLNADLLRRIHDRDSMVMELSSENTRLHAAALATNTRIAELEAEAQAWKREALRWRLAGIGEGPSLTKSQVEDIEERLAKYAEAHESEYTARIKTALLIKIGQLVSDAHSASVVRIRDLEADRERCGIDYCELRERADALIVENAKLRETVNEYAHYRRRVEEAKAKLRAWAEAEADPKGGTT